jgi:hypothetical protein
MKLSDFDQYIMQSYTYCYIFLIRFIIGGFPLQGINWLQYMRVGIS